MKQAVGYLRVSGKGQLDGFGFDRQEKSILTFAKKAKYQIVDIYKEEAVSGTTEEDKRPAFQEMITRLLKNGCNTIVIEGMDRLARELRVQENLCVYIASKELELISANTGENITEAIKEDPMKKALIQMQGVFAELDKSTTVLKLKKGRESARAKNKVAGIVNLRGEGKCEGGKGYHETAPELITAAKSLKRKKDQRTGKRLSLWKVSAALADLGYTTSKGNAYSASQVKRLLG